MTNRTELEAKEADCASATDYVDLAEQALADPRDDEYARELLEKAELECQDPGDYVRLATCFAERLDEQDAAAQLLEDAEDACFEAMEYAEVGMAVATLLGDKERGAELIRNAAAEASSESDKMRLATFAEQAGDSKLAESLMSSATTELKEFSDFREMSAKLLAQGDAEQAKSVFLGAERFLNSVSETVEFATTLLNSFDDRERAGQILENAEVDCQFPIDYVSLARGIQGAMGDDSRVDALLMEAAECAMEGEEFVDVAHGYWELRQDAENAKKHFEQALADVSDRQVLQDMAALAAEQIKDMPLALEIYRKTAGRIASSSDFAKLAAEVWQRTGDRDYATQLFRDASDKMMNASELVSLAETVMKTVDDAQMAVSAYRKALASTADHASLEKLLSASNDLIGDGELAREIVGKMKMAAASTKELAATWRHARAMSCGDELCREILRLAEEAAAGPADLELVVSSVEEFAPDDLEWHERLADKIRRRTENEAKYAEFQKLEKSAADALQLMRLARRTAAELEDVAYARKLLEQARAMLEPEPFDGALWQALIETAIADVPDRAFAESLLAEASSKGRHFAGACELSRAVLDSSADREDGQSLARRVLEQWDPRLETPAERIKLAKVVLELLDDHGWASEIAAACDAASLGALQLAELGTLARSGGDAELARQRYRQAASRCSNAAQAAQLLSKMNGDGVGADVQKEIYAEAGKSLSDEMERLRWAEGIIKLFDDWQWARGAYEELLPEIRESDSFPAYQASRKFLLERRL